MVSVMRKKLDAFAEKVREFKAKRYASEFWRDPYAGMKKGPVDPVRLKALTTGGFDEKFGKMEPVEMRQFRKFFHESSMSLNGEANEQWVTHAVIAIRDGEMKKTRRSLEQVIAGFEKAERDGAPTV